MIAILFTGALFFFISAAIGFAITRQLSNNDHQSVFQNVLAGIVVQLVYFNIWSLFLPTDYKALTLPMVVSLVISAKTFFFLHLKLSFNRAKVLLFSPQNIWVTVSIIIILIGFACVAPFNIDSLAYHYLSILYSEEYRVIPGLANLSAKYGTHSSFFVLSAAYSFSDLFTQAVYPVNFVIVPLFFLKTLYKSFQLTDARRYFIWMALLIFCRYVLINIASPSPDALSMILVFYVLYAFYNGSWSNKSRVMVLFILAAVVLKLNTIPLFLLVLYLLSKRGKRIFAFTIIAGSLIILPWLTRSVIISGYPLFPSQYLNFFNVDWKVPDAIAEAERLHIMISPRFLDPGVDSIEQVSIFKWLPGWYRYQWENNLVNFLLVTATFFSPFFWLFNQVRKEKQYFVLLYLISLAGFWFWLLTSPDIRFGVIFMMFCIFIPLSFLAKTVTVQKKIQGFATLIMVLICLHYARIAFPHIPKNLFTENIVLPARDSMYDHTSPNPFGFVKLSDNVKLYIQDSNYHAVNLPLPVYSAPLRPNIDSGVNVELRGKDVEDGFRYRKHGLP